MRSGAPGFRRTGGIGLAGLLLVASTARSQALIGTAFVEARLFPQDTVREGAPGQNLSGAVELEWHVESSDAHQSLTVVPFIRLDQHDPARTHWDIREFSWDYIARTWEFRAGARKVFWGVTESNHLVDVVNQTDLAEDLDGESKLGQPMLNLALIRSWGTLDLFTLLGFRERNYLGETGRPGLPLPLDRNSSNVDRGYVDWAARWSHTAGALDLGVSHFHGTSRDPRFLPDDAPGGLLVPSYERIDQTGLDLQLTHGSYLWKLEGINRAGQGRRFAAVTGGVEYTLANLGPSGLDLGLLAEYSFDERGREALTPFEDDVFVAARFALNDVQSTQALTGVAIDRASGATFLTVEATRRFGVRWTLDLKVRGFIAVPPDDRFLFGLRHDDYVQASWNYHF